MNVKPLGDNRMDRRSFIRGLAGLAAIAVSGKTLAFVLQTERERLLSQMIAGGLIEDQTFIIEDSGPVVFEGINRLTIHNCRFIWRVPRTSHFFVFRQCKEILITNCILEDGAQV